MKIIYVDESGNPSMRHQSRFFIASGAIFDIEDFDHMEKTVRSFKDEVFSGKFRGHEIHMYDIVGGKNKFRDMTKDEKKQMLARI